MQQPGVGETEEERLRDPRVVDLQKKINHALRDDEVSVEKSAFIGVILKVAKERLTFPGVCVQLKFWDMPSGERAMGLLPAIYQAMRRSNDPRLGTNSFFTDQESQTLPLLLVIWRLKLVGLAEIAQQATLGHNNTSLFHEHLLQLLKESLDTIMGTSSSGGASEHWQLVLLLGLCRLGCESKMLLAPDSPRVENAQEMDACAESPCTEGES